MHGFSSSSLRVFDCFSLCVRVKLEATGAGDLDRDSDA